LGKEKIMLKVEEVRKLSGLLAGIDKGSDTWRGLVGLLEDSIGEANEMSTRPDQDRRDYYAGYERGLRDALADLVELQAGKLDRFVGAGVEVKEDGDEEKGSR
jgi:hypothetical protein